MDNFSSDFKSDLSDLCLSWCQTLKIAFFCDMIPCNLVAGSHIVVEELPAVISEVADIFVVLYYFHNAYQK